MQVTPGLGVAPIGTLTRPAADPQAVRVATFNVWGLPRWLKRAAPDRSPQIARELAQLAPDIVLLQEVWTQECYSRLTQSTLPGLNHWVTVAARRGRGLLGQNGLLTLTRFPVLQAQFLPFHHAQFPDSLVCKGALKVTLQATPSRRLNVWNVHLQDGRDPSTRARQLDELQRWLEEAHDGQVADLIGGDFNFTPDSAEFARFVSDGGLSVHQLAHTNPTPTWDALRPGKEPGEILDHIFVRLPPGAPLHVARAETRRLFDPPRREDRLSDHMGVEATLVLRGAPPADGITPDWAVRWEKTPEPAAAATAALILRAAYRVSP